VQDLLYEFHRGELPEADRQMVEAHLAQCERCSTAATEIRELLSSVPVRPTQPSEKRPAQFWNNFAVNVINQIRREEQRQSVRKVSFGEYLQSVLIYQRRALVTVGLGVAVVAAIVLTRQLVSVEERDGEQLARVENEAEIPTVQARLGQYLRKSQVLMVGLMNMKTENGNGFDLNAERTASRALIQEARYLSGQDIDERAKRLIGDLEKILIELANIEESHDLPDVEILRAGIRQENLLFKLRMGEQLYPSPPPQPRGSNNRNSTKGESL
ncbi:MAG TPA: zf-HC2 domain-containing protein, partial [Bacteroidota bacterium]